MSFALFDVNRKLSWRPVEENKVNNSYYHSLATTPQICEFCISQLAMELNAALLCEVSGKKKNACGLGHSSLFAVYRAQSTN